MEEKVLIKSESNKNLWRKIQIILLIIAIFASILLSCQYEDTYYYYSYIYGYEDTTYHDIGWALVFDFGDHTFLFILFLIGALSLLLAIVSGILYLIYRKCEIQITESSVKGKALFGKEVVLPLYMVSAYSTQKFCSVIAVATASGMIKFAFIGNYKEIGEVLAQKMREIQQSSETTKQKASNGTSLDELVKLKSLLDSGIISQEEFDAKKKQLLDL